MYCTQISNSTVHRFVSIDIISSTSVFVVAQSDHQWQNSTWQSNIWMEFVVHCSEAAVAFYDWLQSGFLGNYGWTDKLTRTADFFFSFAHYRSSCYFTDHLYFAGIKSLSTVLSVSWDPCLNLKKKIIIINEETNYFIVFVFTYITSSPGSLFVAAVFVFSPSGNMNSPYGHMRISCSSRLAYVDVL